MALHFPAPGQAQAGDGPPILPPVLRNALPHPLKLALAPASRPRALHGAAAGRGWVAAVVVLVLHGLLLLAANQRSLWRSELPDASASERQPALVWLLNRAASKATLLEPRPEAQAEFPRPGRPPASRHDTEAGGLPPVPANAVQAITWPGATIDTRGAAADPGATPDAGPLPGSASTQPGAATAATPPTPALNLQLPRGPNASWRPRNPALDDARANTKQPVNLSTLVERALGGDPHGPITEEVLADGSVRFRRGRSCVIARPSRAQTIDPFNSSFSAKPRLLDSC